ncbi:MAG TPA: efflux RND transporter periplasmic adaptor subunit [Syntrophales bacterium]|nr:efflux RND transporter periplasmic adaptor subunit [Syntrophales bacterium]
MTGKASKVTFLRAAVLVSIAATSLLFFVMAGCGKGDAEKNPSLPIVRVAQVIRQNVPVYTEWIGTTDGKVNATIRAQVQGYLIKQLYREGDFVKKGQILFEIDPRTFQAALDQAKGQLEEQKARWVTAKANLARIEPLAKQNAVSKKDLDDAMGAEKEARAAVISAEAAVEKTKLDLGFTKIYSPIDGIAGIAKAQIGNLVGPGMIEELTTVSTVDPIKVYVPVGEQEYLKLVGKDGPSFKHIPLELILSSGQVHPFKGYFALVDRQVDIKTGTIKLAAFFSNPGNIIRPGQFAKVRAESKIKGNALLIPQRAVTELQGGYRVAVVDPGDKIDIRLVKPAERIGSLWVIDEGLKQGDKVVVEGYEKVKQDMIVNPQPYVVSTNGTTSSTEQQKSAQFGPGQQ